MSAIPAIYENGVFRPLGPVDLPERSLVRVVPEAPSLDSPLSDAEWNEGWDAVYEVLSRRYSGDDPRVAERHDEYQP
jgi:predicted DNA-binding antitoxin AbrB/MazE fold protein